MFPKGAASAVNVSNVSSTLSIFLYSPGAIERVPIVMLLAVPFKTMSPTLAPLGVVSVATVKLNHFVLTELA